MLFRKRNFSTVAFLATLGFASGANAQTPGNYILTDLGVLPPATGGAQGLGLNASGTVVGFSPTVSANTTASNHAFKTGANGLLPLIDLGTLPGSSSLSAVSSARGINNAGLIIGYSTTTIPAASATSTFNRPALFKADGTIVNLGALGPDTFTNTSGKQTANIGQGQGINNNGYVVGYASINQSGAMDGNSVIFHAFRMNTSTETALSSVDDLGTLAGVGASYAYAINDSNFVVGKSAYSSVSATQGYYHAVKFDSTGIHDLGTLTSGASVANSSEALAINASGVVVGDSKTPTNSNTHAVRYNLDGTITDLQTLTGIGSLANGINASGQIAGTITLNTSINNAFLYTDKMYNLNSYVTNIPTNYVLTAATGINDKGQISGLMGLNPSSTVTAGTNIHAFLLTPVFTVSGTLGLVTVPSAPAQSVQFTFRSTGNADIVKTASVLPDGKFTVGNIPAGTYTLHIKAPLYLQQNITVTVTGGDVTGADATLLVGDTDGNNKDDVNDLFYLLNAFNSAKGDGSGLYEMFPNGDLDLDDTIGVNDLFALLDNFNVSGDN